MNQLEAEMGDKQYAFKLKPNARKSTHSRKFQEIQRKARQDEEPDKSNSSDSGSHERNIFDFSLFNAAPPLSKKTTSPSTKATRKNRNEGTAKSAKDESGSGSKHTAGLFAALAKGAKNLPMLSSATKVTTTTHPKEIKSSNSKTPSDRNIFAELIKSTEGSSSHNGEAVKVKKSGKQSFVFKKPPLPSTSTSACETLPQSASLKPSKSANEQIEDDDDESLDLQSPARTQDSSPKSSKTPASPEKKGQKHLVNILANISSGKRSLELKETPSEDASDLDDEDDDEITFKKWTASRSTSGGLCVDKEINEEHSAVVISLDDSDTVSDEILIAADVNESVGHTCTSNLRKKRTSPQISPNDNIEKKMATQESGTLNADKKKPSSVHKDGNKISKSAVRANAKDINLDTSHNSSTSNLSILEESTEFVNILEEEERTPLPIIDTGGIPSLEKVAEDSDDDELNQPPALEAYTTECKVKTPRSQAAQSRKELTTTSSSPSVLVHTCGKERQSDVECLDTSDDLQVICVKKKKKVKKSKKHKLDKKNKASKEGVERTIGDKAKRKHKHLVSLDSKVAVTEPSSSSKLEVASQCKTFGAEAENQSEDSDIQLVEDSIDSTKSNSGKPEEFKAKKVATTDVIENKNENFPSLSKKTDDGQRKAKFDDEEISTSDISPRHSSEKEVLEDSDVQLVNDTEKETATKMKDKPREKEVLASDVSSRQSLETKVSTIKETSRDSDVQLVNDSEEETPKKMEDKPRQKENIGMMEKDKPDQMEEDEPDKMEQEELDKMEDEASGNLDAVVKGDTEKKADKTNSKAKQTTQNPDMPILDKEKLDETKSKQAESAILTDDGTKSKFTTDDALLSEDSMDVSEAGQSMSLSADGESFFDNSSNLSFAGTEESSEVGSILESRDADTPSTSGQADFTKDLDPDVDDIDGITFFSFGSRDDLDLHLKSLTEPKPPVKKIVKKKKKELTPAASTASTNQEIKKPVVRRKKKKVSMHNKPKTWVAINYHALMNQLETSEEQLLEELEIHANREFLHPALKNAGMCLHVSTLPTDPVGRTFILDPIGVDLSLKQPIRVTQKDLFFPQRTKTSDYTKVKGWRDTEDESKRPKTIMLPHSCRKFKAASKSKDKPSEFVKPKGIPQTKPAVSQTKPQVAQQTVSKSRLQAVSQTASKTKLQAVSQTVSKTKLQAVSQTVSKTKLKAVPQTKPRAVPLIRSTPKPEAKLNDLQPPPRRSSREIIKPRYLQEEEEEDGETQTKQVTIKKQEREPIKLILPKPKPSPTKLSPTKESPTKVPPITLAFKKPKTAAEAAYKGITRAVIVKKPTPALDATDTSSSKLKPMKDYASLLSEKLKDSDSDKPQSKIPVEESRYFKPFEKPVTSKKSAFVSDALDKYLSKDEGGIASEFNPLTHPLLKNKSSVVTFQMPTKQQRGIKTLQMKLQERRLNARKWHSQSSASGSVKERKVDQSENRITVKPFIPQGKSLTEHIADESDKNTTTDAKAEDKQTFSSVRDRGYLEKIAYLKGKSTTKEEQTKQTHDIEIIGQVGTLESEDSGSDDVYSRSVSRTLGHITGSCRTKATEINSYKGRADQTSDKTKTKETGAYKPKASKDNEEVKIISSEVTGNGCRTKASETVRYGGLAEAVGTKKNAKKSMMVKVAQDKIKASQNKNQNKPGGVGQLKSKWKTQLQIVNNKVVHNTQQVKQTQSQTFLPVRDPNSPPMKGILYHSNSPVGRSKLAGDVDSTRKNLNKTVSESDCVIKEDSLDDDDEVQIVSLPSCGKEFCRMGCICDSLKSAHNTNGRRGHCGKSECMFKCICTRATDKVRILRNRKRPSRFNSEDMLFYDTEGMMSNIQESKRPRLLNRPSATPKTQMTCARTRHFNTLLPSSLTLNTSQEKTTTLQEPPKEDSQVKIQLEQQPKSANLPLESHKTQPIAVGHTPFLVLKQPGSKYVLKVNPVTKQMYAVSMSDPQKVAILPATLKSLTPVTSGVGTMAEGTLSSPLTVLKSVASSTNVTSTGRAPQVTSVVSTSASASLPATRDNTNQQSHPQVSSAATSISPAFPISLKKVDESNTDVSCQIGQSSSVAPQSNSSQPPTATLIRGSVQSTHPALLSADIFVDSSQKSAVTPAVPGEVQTSANSVTNDAGVSALPATHSQPEKSPNIEPVLAMATSSAMKAATEVAVSDETKKKKKKKDKKAKKHKKDKDKSSTPAIPASNLVQAAGPIPVALVPASHVTTTSIMTTTPSGLLSTSSTTTTTNPATTTQAVKTPISHLASVPGSAQSNVGAVLSGTLPPLPTTVTLTKSIGAPVTIAGTNTSSISNTVLTKASNNPPNIIIPPGGVPTGTCFIVPGNQPGTILAAGSTPVQLGGLQKIVLVPTATASAPLSTGTKLNTIRTLPQQQPLQQPQQQLLQQSKQLLQLQQAQQQQLRQPQPTVVPAIRSTPWQNIASIGGRFVFGGSSPGKTIKPASSCSPSIAPQVSPPLPIPVITVPDSQQQGAVENVVVGGITYALSSKAGPSGTSKLVTMTQGQGLSGNPTVVSSGPTVPSSSLNTAHVTSVSAGITSTAAKSTPISRNSASSTAVPPSTAVSLSSTAESAASVTTVPSSVTTISSTSSISTSPTKAGSASQKILSGPMLIEIQSDCNWDKHKNEILSQIAKHTTSDSVQAGAGHTSVRVGKYVVEIVSKKEGAVAVPGSKEGTSAVPGNKVGTSSVPGNKVGTLAVPGNKGRLAVAGKKSSSKVCQSKQPIDLGSQVSEGITTYFPPGIAKPPSTTDDEVILIDTPSTSTSKSSNQSAKTSNAPNKKASTAGLSKAQLASVSASEGNPGSPDVVEMVNANDSDPPEIIDIPDSPPPAEVSDAIKPASTSTATNIDSLQKSSSQTSISLSNRPVDNAEKDQDSTPAGSAIVDEVEKSGSSQQILGQGESNSDPKSQSATSGGSAAPVPVSIMCVSDLEVPQNQSANISLDPQESRESTAQHESTIISSSVLTSQSQPTRSHPKFSTSVDGSGVHVTVAHSACATRMDQATGTSKPVTPNKVIPLKLTCSSPMLAPSDSEPNAGNDSDCDSIVNVEDVDVDVETVDSRLGSNVQNLQEQDSIDVETDDSHLGTVVENLKRKLGVSQFIAISPVTPTTWKKPKLNEAVNVVRMPTANQDSINTKRKRKSPVVGVHGILGMMGPEFIDDDEEDDREKIETHNLKERQRRDEMRDKFRSLKNLVYGPREGQKAKIHILSKARDEIKLLEKQAMQLRKLKTNLQQINSQMSYNLANSLGVKHFNVRVPDEKLDPVQCVGPQTTQDKYEAMKSGEKEEADDITNSSSSASSSDIDVNNYVDSSEEEEEPVRSVGGRLATGSMTEAKQIVMEFKRTAQPANYQREERTVATATSKTIERRAQAVSSAFVSGPPKPLITPRYMSVSKFATDKSLEMEGKDTTKSSITVKTAMSVDIGSTGPQPNQIYTALEGTVTKPASSETPKVKPAFHFGLPKVVSSVSLAQPTSVAVTSRTVAPKVTAAQAEDRDKSEDIAIPSTSDSAPVSQSPIPSVEKLGGKGNVSYTERNTNLIPTKCEEKQAIHQGVQVASASVNLRTNQTQNNQDGVPRQATYVELIKEIRNTVAATMNISLEQEKDGKNQEAIQERVSEQETSDDLLTCQESKPSLLNLDDNDSGDNDDTSGMPDCMQDVDELSIQCQDPTQEFTRNQSATPSLGGDEQSVDSSLPDLVIEDDVGKLSVYDQESSTQDKPLSPWLAGLNDSEPMDQEMVPEFDGNNQDEKSPDDPGSSADMQSVDDSSVQDLADGDVDNSDKGELSSHHQESSLPSKVASLSSVDMQSIDPTDQEMADEADLLSPSSADMQSVGQTDQEMVEDGDDAILEDQAGESSMDETECAIQNIPQASREASPQTVSTSEIGGFPLMDIAGDSRQQEENNDEEMSNNGTQQSYDDSLQPDGDQGNNESELHHDSQGLSHDDFQEGMEPSGDADVSCNASEQSQDDSQTSQGDSSDLSMKPNFDSDSRPSYGEGEQSHTSSEPELSAPDTNSNLNLSSDEQEGKKSPSGKRSKVDLMSCLGVKENPDGTMRVVLQGEYDDDAVEEFFARPEVMEYLEKLATKTRLKSDPINSLL